jgi:hypothetical protein
MEILTMILLIFLAMKFVDVIRYIVNADMNGLVTQLVAWLVGVLAVYLTVWAEWATMPTDTWTRILWGVLIGSGAAAAHDLLRAIAKPEIRPALVAPRATTAPVTPAPVA